MRGQIYGTVDQANLVVDVAPECLGLASVDLVGFEGQFVHGVVVEHRRLQVQIDLLTGIGPFLIFSEATASLGVLMLVGFGLEVFCNSRVELALDPLL